MKSLVSVTAALLASGVAFTHAAEPSDDPVDSQSADQKKILISYRNLTAGQAFSPSVFYSHNEAAPPLFVEGQPAPFALQRIAEEGNVGPLLTGRLSKISGGAYRHWTLGASAKPQATRTVAVLVSEEHPFVTGAFMLAMTNDGFSGIHAIDAYSLQEPMQIELFAYDAGTEVNNELGDSLIAMEGTARDPESGVVHRHEGLRGDADAPGFWKFDPALPVAIVTITPAP